MSHIDTNTQPVVTALDDKLVQAVGDFVRWCVGEELPIVRGWANAVSRPKGAYVMVTPMSLASWNATTTRSYAPDEDDNTKGTVRIGRSSSRTVQVDIYGPNAEADARACSIIFQDLTACDFFDSYSITPLTISVPQDMTSANGAEEAEKRWMFEMTVQPGADFASVAVRLDFFDTVDLALRPQKEGK